MLARSGPHPMTPVSAGVKPVFTPWLWRRACGAVMLSVRSVHPISRVASSG